VYKQALLRYTSARVKLTECVCVPRKQGGWALGVVQRKPTNGHASMSSLESRQHLLLLQGGMPICSDRVKDELREQLSEIPRCSETSLITRFEFVQCVE
jgi:hypothetical protein